ncbi:response regulator [Caulobacter sp. BK020]|uniref:response regulator transcription factor n=1 Tax=Caulobacter sp. BK020 TaxID=2512117 RepID=UPI001050A0B7|nr:response regulator [Caulobacter sp. BK020]TCS14520.1 response regulator receiver domain-containing protein [Caulobacter sp. BK020]
MNMVQPGTRILVADSDRAVLEMLQIRLDLAGYHALAARSGPAALEVAHNMRPAILVLDLVITEMSAFEVMAALQRDVARPVGQILLVGKRLGVDEVKRGAALGVRACMLKPFSGADLVERVGKMLKPPSPTPAPGNGFAPRSAPAGRPSPSSDVFI